MAFLANQQDQTEEEQLYGGSQPNAGAGTDATLNVNGGGISPLNDTNQTGTLPTGATGDNTQTPSSSSYTNLADYLTANDKASNVLSSNVAGNVNAQVDAAAAAPESVYTPPSTTTTTSSTYNNVPTNTTEQYLNVGGKQYSGADVRNFYSTGGDENSILDQAGVTDAAQRQAIIEQARGMNNSSVVNWNGVSGNGNYYTADQVKQFVQQNKDNPAEIAKQASSLGLTQQQITDILNASGVQYSSQDVGQYAKDNGYTFNPTSGAVAAPTTAAPKTSTTSGTGTGDPTNGNYSAGRYLPITQNGETGLQQQFARYQAVNPNGAWISNYEQWKRNLAPHTRSAMESGTYTGAATNPTDFAPGGIYEGVDFTYAQSGYGDLGIGAGRTATNLNGTPSGTTASNSANNSSGRLPSKTTTTTSSTGSWDPAASEAKLQTITDAQLKAKLLETVGGRTELLSQILNPDGTVNRTNAGALNLDEFIMSNADNEAIPGAIKKNASLKAVYDRLIADLNSTHTLGTAKSSSSTQYGAGKFTPEEVNSFIQQNKENPAEIARQAALLGLTQAQITTLLNQAGMGTTSAEVGKYAKDNGYTFAANGSLVAPAPVVAKSATQPAPTAQATSTPAATTATTAPATSTPAAKAPGTRWLDASGLLHVINNKGREVVYQHTNNYDGGSWYETQGVGDGAPGDNGTGTLGGMMGDLGTAASSVGIGPGASTAGSVGNAIGTAIGGPLGGLIGGAIGNAVGNEAAMGEAADAANAANAADGFGTIGMGDMGDDGDADGEGDADGDGGSSGWAKGGPISGPGTSTSDSIDARLSDGEYVIKAAAVEKFGKAFFDHLNNSI